MWVPVAVRRVANCYTPFTYFFYFTLFYLLFSAHGQLSVLRSLAVQLTVNCYCLWLLRGFEQNKMKWKMKLLCLCSGLTMILSISVSCGRPIDTSTTCGTILHTSTPLMTLWRTIAVRQSTELDIPFCVTWTLWVSVQRSDCITKCCFCVFLSNVFFKSVKRLYNHYINHNQSLFAFEVSISIRDLRQKKVFNSSSGPCRGSDVTWQEIGRTCGSVYSCPRPGS